MAAQVTPSRQPFKSVKDSRVNNGAPKRSRPLLKKSPGSDNVSATQLSNEVCLKEVVGNVVGRILEEVRKV